MAHYERAAAESAHNPRRRLEVVEGYRKMSSPLATLSDWATEFDEVHLRIMALLRGVLSDCPTSASCREGVGHALRLWTYALEADRARLPEAETAFREAVSVFEGITADFPDLPADWHFLADSHRRLGRVLERNDKAKEAEQAYRQAIAVHEQRAAKFPDKPEFQYEWSLSYSDLANILAGRPDQGAYWSALGAHQYRAGKWTEAVAALEKSSALPDGPHAGTTALFLAMAQWQLGNKDQARERYDEAVKWVEKNQPQDEQLRRLRAEAAGLLGVERAETGSGQPQTRVGGIPGGLTEVRT
jgi:tetratricopeptide (TPR) repeat protein